MPANVYFDVKIIMRDGIVCTLVGGVQSHGIADCRHLRDRPGLEPDIAKLLLCHMWTLEM